MINIDNLKHYIAFQGDNSVKGKNIDSENIAKLKSLSVSLKNGEHNHLVAKFVYDGVKPKRADIDNILLYNLRIDHLEHLESFVLEKRVDKDCEKKGPEYQFDFNTSINTNKNKKVVCQLSVHIDVNQYNNFDKSFDRTKYLYQLFRKEVLLIATSGKYKSPLLENNECELYIKYNGNIAVKESTFLKPLIDGLISSLHKFKINSPCSYSNQNVLSFIETNLEHADVSLVENTNGGNLLTAHNPPHFNPMDEMIKKLIFEKIGNSNETIDVEIREIEENE